MRMPVVQNKGRSSSTLAGRRSARNDHQQADSRMDGIDQVILAIDVIDIDVVVVTPACGPRLAVFKPIAAVIEAAIVATRDAESMFPSEVSAKILVGNAAGVAIAGVALRWLHIIVRVALRLLLGRAILLGAILFSLLFLFDGLLLLLFILLLRLVRLSRAVGLFLILLLIISGWLFLLRFLLRLLFLLRGLLAFGFLLLGFFLLRFFFVPVRLLESIDGRAYGQG